MSPAPLVLSVCLCFRGTCGPHGWSSQGDINQTAVNVNLRGSVCTKGKKHGKCVRGGLLANLVSEQPPQDSGESREQKDDRHGRGEGRSAAACRTVLGQARAECSRS